MTVDASNWNEYQEEVADFFRAAGPQAETNESIQGVRTSHNIDVAVRGEIAAMPFLWLIECKFWKTASVPKEKVAALRDIVADIGADRGFIMAEGGFQAGAFEAAKYSNITLSSITELTPQISETVALQRLRRCLDRSESCRERYQRIGKEDRIDLDLRPDILNPGTTSTSAVLGGIESVVYRAHVYGPPLEYNASETQMGFHPFRYDAPSDLERTSRKAYKELATLADVLERDLASVEEHLSKAEKALESRAQG